MRRFTGVMLAFAVLLSSVCFGTVSAADKAVDKEADSRVNALIELGYIKSYAPEAEVPRETVDKTLIAVTGSNALSVRFLGENYKNEAMKVGQFLPILIDLAGYTDYVAASYGEFNQTNCRVVAQKIGILKGVSAANTDKMTMEVFVKLLSNTLLEVDVMKQTVFSDAIGKYEIVKGRKTINEICGIVWIEGVLKGMGKINLTTMSELNEDQIRIESSQYAYKRVEDPDKYVGRYVRAYMKEDDPDKVLALEIVDRKNSVFKLESEDLVPSRVAETQLAYSNENGRTKTIKLSDTVNVVYNGEFVPFYGKDDLLAEDAFFTLIDVGCDDVYDTVIIDKYTPILVNSLSNGTNSYTVADIDSNTYSFDDFFEDGYSFLEENGKAARWKDIEQYDVLSVRQSKTGVYNKIIHSIRKSNGIYRISSEDMKYITIDDKEYQTTSALRNNKVMLNRVKLGDEVSVFFDAFGRVVGIISYGNTNQFAAVMGIASYSMDGYKMKYLAEDGKVYVKSVSDRLKVNGTKMKLDDALGTNSALFYENGELKEQLVRIRLNSDDEIAVITTANQAPENGAIGYDDFTLNYDSGSDTMSIVTTNSTTVVQSRYIADGYTPVFMVCTDDDEYCEVMYGTFSDNFIGKIYNVDTDYYAGAVLRKYSKKATFNRNWVNVNSDAYLVDHIAEVIHPYNEGETAICVYAWNADKLHTLVCDDPDYTPNTNKYNYMAWTSENIRANFSDKTDDTPLKKEVVNKWMQTKWKDLKPGSLIGVRMTNGLVQNFTIQYMPPEEGDLPIEQRVFEGIENNSMNGSWVIGTWSYGLNKNKISGQTVIANGIVQQVNKFGIVLNCHIPSSTEGSFPVESWNRSIPMSQNARIYIYDPSNSRTPVRIGSTADIEVGDSFVYRKAGNNTDFLMIDKSVK